MVSWVYTVKKGDTLGAIAKRIGVSVEKLMELNRDKIKDPNKIQIGWELNLTDPEPPPPPPTKSGGPIKGKGGRGYKLNYDGEGKPPPNIKTINPTSEFGRPASAVLKEPEWRKGEELPNEVKIPVGVAVEKAPEPPPAPKETEGPTWQEKVAMAINDVNTDPAGSLAKSVSKIATRFGMNEAMANRLGRDAVGMFQMGGLASGAGMGTASFGRRITDPRHAPIDPIKQGWRQGMNRPPQGEVSVVGERPLTPTSLTPESLAPRGLAPVRQEPPMGPPQPANLAPEPRFAPTRVETPLPPEPGLTGGAPLSAPLPTPAGRPTPMPFGGGEPPALTDRSLRPGVRGKLENTLLGTKTKRERFKKMGGEESVDPAFNEVINKGKIGTLNTPEPVFIPANQINTVKDLGRVIRAAGDKTIVLENASDLGFASDRVLIVRGKGGADKISPESVLDSFDPPVLTQAMFTNILKHIGFK